VAFEVLQTEYHMLGPFRRILRFVLESRVELGEDVVDDAALADWTAVDELRGAGAGREAEGAVEARSATRRHREER